MKLKRSRWSDGYLMANQLRRGEIGEPVELVAQIVQDGPIGLNCWYRAWLADVLMESRVANWTFSFYATCGQVIFGLITMHSLTSGGLYLYCKSGCRQHGQALLNTIGVRREKEIKLKRTEIWWRALDGLSLRMNINLLLSITRLFNFYWNVWKLDMTNDVLASCVDEQHGFLHYELN